MQRLNLCIALIICVVCFALVEAKPPSSCSPCQRQLVKRPVCAQLCGRKISCTFASHCEVKRQCCLRNEKWTVVSQGMCKNPSSKCKRRLSF